MATIGWDTLLRASDGRSDLSAKVEIVIPTCDRYRNITQPVLYSLEKYYPGRGKGVIVGYRPPDFGLPSDVDFVSVGQDQTPARWTNGLKRFIERYSQDYFILHMDDHLLIDRVESDRIDQLCGLMETNPRIDKIMLHPFTSSMFQPYPTAEQDLLLFKCENGIGTTTLMNALWRREYLLELLSENLSPHDFENQSMHRNLSDKLVLSTHNRIMMVTSLMNGGSRNRNWHICPRREFEYTVSDEEYIARVNEMMDLACPA